MAHDVFENAVSAVITFSTHRVLQRRFTIGVFLVFHIEIKSEVKAGRVVIVSKQVHQIQPIGLDHVRL